MQSTTGHHENLLSKRENIEGGEKDLGVPTALRTVIIEGMYTEPHLGTSTSGTKTVAGKTTQ